MSSPVWFALSGEVALGECACVEVLDAGLETVGSLLNVGPTDVKNYCPTIMYLHVVAVCMNVPVCVLCVCACVVCVLIKVCVCKCNCVCVYVCVTVCACEYVVFVCTLAFPSVVKASLSITWMTIPPATM